jgi:hypothetical protein
MPETTDHPGGPLPQAVDLAQLVELEARWENLPQAPARSTRDLAAKQAAYEAYRARRATYNGRYQPAHDPRVLAHTPARLGAWLRAMRDLFARAEADPRCPCPVHLMEKARRCAERVALRLNVEPPAPPPAPPGTVRAAVEGLETLARWCQGAAPA